MELTLSHLAVLMLGLAESVTKAEEAAPIGTIDKENVSSGGSGCPQGTSGVISGDANRFIAIRTSDSFRASVGRSVPLADSRKTCQIGVLVKPQPGMQFAVSRGMFTGDANLNEGVSAYQNYRYCFMGSTDQITGSITLNGYRRGY